MGAANETTSADRVASAGRALADLRSARELADALTEAADVDGDLERHLERAFEAIAFLTFGPSICGGPITESEGQAL